jgi:hypothetical protein
MPKLLSAAQETDLLIQRSLIIRIQAAAKVHKSASTGGHQEPLKSYLSALESLAEYVATRCRGAAVFDEVKAAGHQEDVVQAPVKTRKRGPKVVQLNPPEEPAAFATGSHAGCESLAG